MSRGDSLIHVERQILLTAMLRASSLPDMPLLPKHFASEQHADLWELVLELSQDAKPFDAVSVSDAAARLGRRALADLAIAIAGAHDNFPASDARYPSGLLVTAWRDREARAIAAQLADEANRREEGAIDRAISALMALHAEDRDCEHTAKSAMRLAWDEVLIAKEAGGRIIGVPTGLVDLDETLGGLHDSDLIVIGARPAMGKEQPNSAMILMADGTWKPMGEMRVGMRLASVDGKPSVVSGVFPQGQKKTYTFTFSDGRSTRAGIDHLWEVMYRDWDSPRVLTTAKILSMLEKKRYVNRLSVRMISGDFGADHLIKIDPWMLGYLLVDGNFTRGTPRFSTADMNVLERIRSLLPEGYSLTRDGQYDWNVVGKKGKKNWLTTALSELGLWGKYSHEKRIPSLFFSAPRQTRLSLMQGIMDADGWSEKYNCVRVSVSSRDFASDIQSLARSLGMVCSMRKKATSHRDSYSLTIRGKGQKDLFWLERKAERVSERKHEIRLTLKSVEPANEEQCSCIMVTHPSHLYVTDDYVVTHNTGMLLGMTMAGSRDGHPVGLISGEQPAAQVGLRWMAAGADVSVGRLRAARIEEHQWSRLSRAVTETGERSIRILDRSSPDIAEVTRVARRWKHQYGIRALYVDYLQKLEISALVKSPKHERIGAIARALKNLARDLQIPVVALAQVNRKVDESPTQRPGMSHLADSSEIEKEADQIMMLWRDQTNPLAETAAAEINVVKNRHGNIGTVHCLWRGGQTAFVNLARDQYPEAA